MPPTTDQVIVTSKSQLRGVVADEVENSCLRALVIVQSEQHDVKAWLTNAETMAYLGLSRSTLARYRAGGTLPYSKLGANIYYRLQDIERVLESLLQEGME